MAAAAVCACVVSALASCCSMRFSGVPCVSVCMCQTKLKYTHAVLRACCKVDVSPTRLQSFSVFGLCDGDGAKSSKLPRRFSATCFSASVPCDSASMQIN